MVNYHKQGLYVVRIACDLQNRLRESIVGFLFKTFECHMTLKSEELLPLINQTVNYQDFLGEVQYFISSILLFNHPK